MMKKKLEAILDIAADCPIVNTLYNFVGNLFWEYAEAAKIISGQPRVIHAEKAKYSLSKEYLSNEIKYLDNLILKIAKDRKYKCAEITDRFFVYLIFNLKGIKVIKKTQRWDEGKLLKIKIKVGKKYYSGPIAISKICKKFNVPYMDTSKIPEDSLETESAWN